MSQYDVPEPEDLFECPYDNTHMIRAKRQQYHLMKCRRNYTGADYAVCPFNARHEMPRPELRFHMAHCKDRAVLEQDIIYAQQKLEKQSELAAPNYKSDWEPPRSNEDWERDIPLIPRIGVEPNFLKDKNIIRNLTGMTPAQKKVFHLTALKNYERHLQGLPPLEDEPVESKPAEVTGVNGLRLPREQPLILRQIQQMKPKKVDPQPPSVFVHSLAMAGIGRGKTPSSISSASLPKPGTLDRQFSRGKPEFVVPKTTSSRVVDLRTEGQDSDSGSSSCEDTEEAKMKEAQKLNKKLREIQILEARKSAGLPINSEEEKKIQNKAVIVRRILNLA